MTTNRVHLNEFRESWVFLVIGSIGPTGTKNDEGSPGEDVCFWELAVGNADQLVEVSAARSDASTTSSKQEVVEALHEELDDYRYQNSILITPTETTVTTLRKEILAHTPGASLRGFHHIPLQTLLSRYLDQELCDHGLAVRSRNPPHLTESTDQEQVYAETVEDFWRVWKQIFTLIPATELQGEPL